VEARAINHCWISSQRHGPPPWRPAPKEPHLDGAEFSALEVIISLVVLVIVLMAGGRSTRTFDIAAW